MDLVLAKATAVVVGGGRGSLDSAVADMADRGSPDVLGYAADIGDAVNVDKAFGEIATRCNGELTALSNTVGPGAPARMPRRGLPEEIGPVVAFLVTRRNSHMIGANINVDGGSDFT